MKNMVKDDIFCMSNMIGKDVKQPHKLPFSFYFSTGDGKSHEVRVQVMFNPDRLRSNLVGTMKLCDDWEFIPGDNDTNIKQNKINRMKQFFRKYLIFFCAVWDNQLDEGALYDYFTGGITIQDLIDEIYIDSDIDLIDDLESTYGIDCYSLDDSKIIEYLENYCRNNNYINLRDN